MRAIRINTFSNYSVIQFSKVFIIFSVYKYQQILSLFSAITGSFKYKAVQYEKC